MKEHVLQFAIPYVGLFRGTSPQSAHEIQRASDPLSAFIALYETQGATLAIAIGDTHTESVGLILDKWHSVTEGGSFIGPILSKLQTPPLSDVWIVSTTLSTIPDSVLRAIGESDDVFAVLNLANSVVVMIAREKTSLYLDSTRQTSGNLTRFASYWSSAPVLQKRTSARHYDPILAQVSELTRQTLPALRERVQFLSAVWQQTFPSEKFNELTELDQAAVFWRDRLLTLAAQDSSGAELMATVDRVAQDAEADIRVCTDLAAHLADYVCADPLSAPESYISGGNSLTLKAATSYATSLLDRLGLAHEYRALPFFGDRYSVFFSLFRLLPSFLKRPLSHSLFGTSSRSTLPLMVPQNHRLRLGAMPILAHELAHLRLRAIDGIKLIETLASGVYGGYITEAIHPKQGSVDQAFQTTNETSYADHLLRRAEEMAADLIACSVAGPAYIYAVVRFVAGTLSEFNGAPTAHEDFPAFADRMHICISHMQSTGIDPDFHSQHWKPRYVEMPEQFQSDLIKLIAQPYSTSDHDHALGNVQASLIRGQVIHADSGHILNALWDAVVRRRGYANELTAMYSMILPAHKDAT